MAGVVPDFANLAAGDTRGRHPRFKGENFAKNRALVERVEAIADRESAAPRRSSASPGCWRRAPDVIPIPGTKQIDRLEENLGALDVRLTPEEADRISTVDPGRRRRRHPLPRRRHARRVYLRHAAGRGRPISDPTRG